MLTFREFIQESEDLKKLPFDKNPKIGWWKDHDHVTLYHGTHESRVASIHKNGLKAPKDGPTAGNISMALEPYTSHGYASMTGGESSFRKAGSKARSVPHHERAVMVYKVPKSFIEKHSNPHLRGNTDDVKDHLTNKSKYEAHAKSGKVDHEHYAKTELRFSHMPNEYLMGYMKKH